MERTQNTNTNNKNGVADNWREYVPVNQVNTFSLPSPLTDGNNNHGVVNPSTSTSLSTQNHPVLYTNMSQNNHNSRFGVSEYYLQNNHPLNYLPENPHTPRLSRPEYYKSENPYVSRLGLQDYYSQNSNFSIYPSENHHNPYVSLKNMMERLNILRSRSHASSSYGPSLYRHHANLRPNEITPPSSARSLSNNPYNYVDRFLPSSEHMMIGYPESEAIREPTEKQGRCLLLQSKLKMGLSEKGLDDIFSEVMKNIGDLMVDRYGHGLVIDLLKKCDARQTSTIVKGLVERNLMIYICLNEHGCKVVQTLFEQLKIRKQANQIRMICDVLSSITMILIDNCNGCHVIKRCLEVFVIEDNWQVAEKIGYHALKLVIDKKGIIVLNACIKIAHEELREHIINTFDGKMVFYSKHPYGNYLVQSILKTEDARAIARVVAQLKGNFVSMAMNKFASNVVEKCFLYSTQDQVGSIISELTNDSHFKYMIHDEFGNYVAKFALKKAQGPQLICLLEKILEHKGSLDGHPHGNNLLFLARAKAKCCHLLHH